MKRTMTTEQLAERLIRDLAKLTPEQKRELRDQLLRDSLIKMNCSPPGVN
jgi:hypothetical protein